MPGGRRGFSPAAVCPGAAESPVTPQTAMMAATITKQQAIGCAQPGEQARSWPTHKSRIAAIAVNWPR
jgi:hypothetical protein